MSGWSVFEGEPVWVSNLGYRFKLTELATRVDVTNSRSAMSDLVKLIRRSTPADAAIDCCDPEHWKDNQVGLPGGHDGGLPEFERTPCVPFGRLD